MGNRKKTDNSVDIGTENKRCQLIYRFVVLFAFSHLFNGFDRWYPGTV